MATSTISGKDGSVTGLTGVTEIVSFTADVAEEVLVATNFTSGGFTESVVGNKSISGSLVAKGDTIPPTGSVSLVLKAGGTGATEITTTALISVSSMSVDSEGLVEYTADFVGTGSFTVGTVA